MSRGEDIFGQLQKKARTDGAETARQPPTAEYLTRHGLESFLDRLTHTEHAEDFVLKGGILLAAYGARRPTKDVDAEAISSAVTAENVAQIVTDIAEVHTEDGVEFDVGSLDVQEIRAQAEYPGLRARVNISIGTFSAKVLWDISTGDLVTSRVRHGTVVAPVRRTAAKSRERLEVAARTFALAAKRLGVSDQDALNAVSAQLGRVAP